MLQGYLTDSGVVSLERVQLVMTGKFRFLWFGFYFGKFRFSWFEFCFGKCRFSWFGFDFGNLSIGIAQKTYIFSKEFRETDTFFDDSSYCYVLFQQIN